MLDKPYRRIIRPFTLSEDGYCVGVLDDSYLMDSDYAPDRVTLIRAYNTIERDLVRLFEYVEPADANLSTYSHRIYELFLRACTEFEANCKGILSANAYAKSGNWNIADYYRINSSSRLSDYDLRIAFWHDGDKVLRPFSDWATGSSVSWYQDYNAVKHNRSGKFGLASLHNLLLAVSGVFAVLFSQFFILSFRAHASVGMYNQGDGWFSHENSIFAIKPPQTWTADECYHFEWSDLVQRADRFDAYSF
jgi:hypothetical protein